MPMQPSPMRETTAPCEPSFTFFMVINLQMIFPRSWFPFFLRRRRSPVQFTSLNILRRGSRRRRPPFTLIYYALQITEEESFHCDRFSIQLSVARHGSRAHCDGVAETQRGTGCAAV